MLNRMVNKLMVALAFAIPMPVAINNLVLILLLLMAMPLFWRELSGVVRRSAVVRGAVALFGLLALGTLWGESPWIKAMGLLGKYDDLLFVPLFILLLRNPQVRERSLLAFFTIMTIVLILSWSIHLRLLPLTPIVIQIVGSAATIDASVFHSHITQGVLISFVCYLSAMRARESTGRVQVGWIGLSIFSGANVLFVMQGGTGYLVLFLLFGLFGWILFKEWLARNDKQFKWQYGLVALLFPILVMVLAWFGAPRFQERGTLALSEVRNWQAGQSHVMSSMGTRLDFYANTLRLIGAHPLVGYGTGGFGVAFAKQTDGQEINPTQNPHNEYLMLAVQVGLLGPLLLAGLFITMWRTSGRLPEFERYAARGLVLTYALTCGVNSMLLDHTEGLFFAWMTAWLFAPLARGEMSVAVS